MFTNSTSRLRCPVSCSLAILTLASAAAAQPANDECSSPEPIVGEGSFVYDSTGATTGAEGQGNANCAFNGTTGIANDVWFCWTATCTGLVTIDTCGQTQLDTKIAVYQGCACPITPSNALCCNDDACDLQSQIVCEVVCGEEYMIQVGQFPDGTPGGPFGLRITCEGDPCDEECCIDFDDGDGSGFAPCPAYPNVTTFVDSPGPSGDANDLFLHVIDGSGSSLVCGEVCPGDWTAFTDNGCGALCWDYIVIDDSCHSGIPECVANGGYLDITPRMIITSGSLRAIFIANFTVTDPDGPDSGWHSLCAPIRPLNSDGTLPSNEFGEWVMLDGAPDSDWPVLLSNVTGVQLPIEFTANPAEEAGYDNICLRDDVCPCLVVSEVDVECPLDGSDDHLVTFQITNHSDQTAHWLLVPATAIEPDDDSVTVSPNVIPIDPPLPPDGTTVLTVNLTLSGAQAGDEVCFLFSLADENVDVCCEHVLCVEIPECDCVQIHDVVFSNVHCNPDGTVDFDLDFTIDNLTDDVAEHLFLISQTTGVSFDPDYIDLPSVAPNGSYTVSTSVVGAMPGHEFCFMVAIHQENMALCCAEEFCLTAPLCDPVGACVLCDGTCEVLTEDECQLAGGFYCGDGSNCNQPCGLAAGACCFADGSCADTVFCECEALGGTFVAGASCDEGPCDPGDPPLCPGDCDGNGQLDVDDLVSLILAWGTSNPDADINGDGIVDVDDLVLLILAWGAC